MRSEFRVRLTLIVFVPDINAGMEQHDRSRPVTQPTYQTPAPGAALPKRKAGSRFTSGHLLMVVSGMLAFLLAIVVLRAGGSTITVYVAKEDIVPGKQLSASQFNPVEIPSSDLDDQYVNKGEITDGKNYYAARAISKGEPLLDDSRTPDQDKNGVRIQSLPIDKALAVNGALSKGDRVDVIQTFDEGDGCAFRALENLEVVSAPTGSSGGGALSGSKDGFVISVAISNPSDDLTLAGVIASGSFQVVKTTGDKSDRFIEDPICGDPTNVSNNGE